LVESRPLFECSAIAACAASPTALYHAKPEYQCQINRKTGLPGFAGALWQLHWIAEHPDGIHIIHFAEHNGASAKRRSEDARRNFYVRKHSDKNGTNPGNPADNDGRIAELEKEKKEKRKKKRERGAGGKKDAVASVTP
jgi:hypothetical protein